MECQIKAFVDKMHTAAATAIQISSGATKLTFSQLEDAKKQGNPLIVEALKYAEDKIKAATAHIRRRIGGMGSKELGATLKRVDETDRNMINRLLEIRKSVTVKPIDGDWNDPFFVEALSTYEGESIFSPHEWRDILAGNSTHAAISDVYGVMMAGQLSLKFQTAEAADVLRDRLLGFGDVVITSPPYNSTLIEELQTGGYLAAPQGNPLPAEAQAFVTGQAELF
jgi:hypothetical protein